MVAAISNHVMKLLHITPSLCGFPRKILLLQRCRFYTGIRFHYIFAAFSACYSLTFATDSFVSIHLEAVYHHQASSLIYRETLKRILTYEER